MWLVLADLALLAAARNCWPLLAEWHLHRKLFGDKTSTTTIQTLPSSERVRASVTSNQW